MRGMWPLVSILETASALTLASAIELVSVSDLENPE